MQIPQPNQNSGIFALTLSASLLAGMAPAYAGDAVPAVPLTTNCQAGNTKCGLYVDLSGDASSSSAGTRDSFSYQPSYTNGNYRFVVDSAADSFAAQSSASASNFTSFGLLKSKLSASSYSPVSAGYMPNTGAGVDSNIGFQDRLTFSLAGAPTGTRGTMIGRLAVTGNLDANTSFRSPYGYATAGAVVNASGGLGTVTNRIQEVTYAQTPLSGSMPSFITFEAAVSFNALDFTNVSVYLDTGIRSGVLSVIGQSYNADANVDYSVEWAGIDSVVDSKGNPITGWSVSSASGFDYSRSYASQVTAVPEPDTYAMLLAGLGLIGTIARRRRAVVRG